MKNSDILQLRLLNQGLVGQMATTPTEVVRRLGALQAQDYPGALWSIAVRNAKPNQASVEKAIQDRSIVRTWPMRGTLHFVASEDVRWMLSLLTPRIISGMAGRNRQLELDQSVFMKSQDILLAALEGGKQHTRAEVYALLEDQGIATANQRGIHIINYLAQIQVLCHGTHHEKQPTYTLLDEWIPKTSNPSAEEALARLTLKYFIGHGPATLQDFIWWTGLKISEAKAGLQAVSSQLTQQEVDGITYWFSPELGDTLPKKTTLLLPGFDEFMLGYTHRSLMVDSVHLGKVVPGNNGMFMSTVVINGKVKALWKRTLQKGQVRIELFPFDKLSSSSLDQIALAAKKYGAYLGTEAILIH